MFNKNISSRYLERDGVSLDLRHVLFERDALYDEQYIVFLSVHRAFYTNFELITSLSLESLALHILQEVKHKVPHEPPRSYADADLVQYIFVNEHDHGQSMILQLNEDTKIVVARKLYADEHYHKRVSGYMDFERRHVPGSQCMLQTSSERLHNDRDIEIILLQNK
jgi:hypothetical protein